MEGSSAASPSQLAVGELTLTERQLCLSSYGLIPMVFPIIIIECNEILCKSMTYEGDNRAISK